MTYHPLWNGWTESQNKGACPLVAFDRPGISFAERCFCLPGAALLSEFRHMQAFYHRQHYPKVPLGGIRGRPFDRIAILISAVKRVDRVPTLSINSLHPLRCIHPKVPLGGIRGQTFDRIAILISAVKQVDRVPTLSINSLHPYHFDRIGILSARDSIMIRIPAPANMFIQHYPKVPLEVLIAIEHKRPLLHLREFGWAPA